MKYALLPVDAVKLQLVVHYKYVDEYQIYALLDYECKKGTCVCISYVAEIIREYVSPDNLYTMIQFVSESG